MGAGHGQHVTALQHVFGQPLRAAGVGRAGVEDGFHQRELRGAVGLARTADHVADHEHVGLQRHLAPVEAFDQLDADGAQLVAHRGVDASVAAGHGMAGLASQGGQPAHEGAADAENVEVHGPILGRFQSHFGPIPASDGHEQLSIT
jgi:hypothetical protein